MDHLFAKVFSSHSAYAPPGLFGRPAIMDIPMSSVLEPKMGMSIELSIDSPLSPPALGCHL